MLLIDALRYSRAAACEHTRMRARTNETDKTVANRQPCSVATGAHMRSVRSSAGAVGMLEPQNYSRGGESARAAQVAHSSEQAAHAQVCPQDTCCPFWLHPAQRRLQRRDLTRAPLPCTHKRMICMSCHLMYASCMHTSFFFFTHTPTHSHKETSRTCMHACMCTHAHLISR